MIRQYHLPLPQREAMGPEDFLPARANDQAIGWLLRRPASSWPSHAFVLWGPEGSGKTHLLTIWARNNTAAEAVPDDGLLAHVVAGDCAAHAFFIDDADKMAGNPAQEEWLQHFYNATRAASLPLLLTATKPVAQWGLTLRDIETRLKSCPAAELEEPDDALMRGLLMKLFNDRQLIVDGGVVEFLAARLERTGTAIRAAVARLDEAALETGRKISVPFVQKIIGKEC